MFELDGDSGLNNSPLLTLWSLHELNVCNSIAAEQTLPARFVRPIFHGHSHCAHAFVSFVWCSARFSDTINSGLLPEWKGISFTLCPVDCKATVWEYCFAMCRNDDKSIYRLGRFAKLRKQWGFVNTKCNANVQIIFKTQMPLYKLDTSIICCNIIVSTWDVSRKQIGGRSSCATSWEMRGNQWIVKGSFITVVVSLCGNGGQRGIKTSSCFQKCVYSKLKTQENKTYTNSWKIMPA